MKVVKARLVEDLIGVVTEDIKDRLRRKENVGVGSEV